MQESKQLELALFDLDGTITFKNIFLAFTQFAVGKNTFLLRLITILPWLVLYYIGTISDTKLKSIFLKRFFAGVSVKELQNLSSEFNKKHMPELIKPTAMKKIKWHQACGHRVIVVSACIDCWVQEWCNMHNLELIGTQLETSNGYVTGRLITQNCSGQEKVIRLRNYLDISAYRHIYAYGDSRGDKDMLEIADEKFYQKFI